MLAPGSACARMPPGAHHLARSAGEVATPQLRRVPVACCVGRPLQCEWAEIRYALGAMVMAIMVQMAVAVRMVMIGMVMVLAMAIAMTKMMTMAMVLIGMVMIGMARFLTHRSLGSRAIADPAAS